MFFHMDDFLLFAEKNNINREQHPDGMDTTRRHDPQTTSQLRPAPRLSQQAYQPTEITVREYGLCSDEGFASFVVNVERTIMPVTRHWLCQAAPQRYSEVCGSNRRPRLPCATRWTSACAAR